MKPVVVRVLAMSALGAALSAAPARGWAQGASSEPTAAEIAVARKLFSDATALEKSEKWAEAEAKLKEAASIKETPGLRYHLGFCMEQQGKLVGALVEYDRASELLGRGAKAPDVAELVGPAAARVRGRVAQVTVKLEGSVADVKIELDGAPVKAALIGKAMPANPGKHVITATAPGRQAFRREVQVTEAESKDVAITLVPLAAAGPGPGAGKAGSSAGAGPGNSGDAASAGGPSTAEADASVGPSSGSGSTRTYVLIGEAAFTAISLGVGIFYTIDKGNAQDQVDAANEHINKSGGCAKVPKDCEQLPGLQDQRDRAVTFSTLGFIGAGVGAVATVTTFLLWKPAKKTESALWVAPFGSGLGAKEPRGTGIAVGGRF